MHLLGPTLAVCLVAAVWIGAYPAAADNAVDVQEQLRRLQVENEALQQRMRKQQDLIDDLGRKVTSLESNRTVKAEPNDDGVDGQKARAASPVASAFGRVQIGGEAGVGFFKSQSHGQSPNGEFRVDEAKLFIEAPIWGPVYFYSEINLFLREEGNFNLRAGELYLDVENLSRLWNQDKQLNLRAGLIDIPFGEEYMVRDVIDNPLISHSLMDFWGVDEGLELYGAVNNFRYVVAVQNGGIDSQRDFTGDKSVSARVSLDPTRWFHLSLSAMRTGDLDVNKDFVSALWLGPGFVRSLGSTNTTRFHANLVEGDVQLKIARATVKAAGGMLQYDDNDPQASNRRKVYYYWIEGTQPLIGKLYAAARWSQAFAPDGFPIVGNGSVDTYFGGELTRRLNLLSLGLGYRWNEHLVLKGEYSFEWGTEVDGTPRNHENLFAIVAAAAF